MKIDPMAVFNARNFIEEVLARESRIKITDAGVSMVSNSADLGIKIDGMPYAINIKPRDIAR